MPESQMRHLNDLGLEPVPTTDGEAKHFRKLLPRAMDCIRGVSQD